MQIIGKNILAGDAAYIYANVRKSISINAILGKILFNINKSVAWGNAFAE
jgi:hypothetical protein